MTRGRKTEVTRLVQRLDGSDEAKARLTLFLEVLAGKRTVVEAALGLGLGERQFHTLRNRCLQAALASLEPRLLGRPTRQQADVDGRVASLEAQVQSLRLDLRAAQIREEIALAMPHLLHRRGRSKKAGRKKARQRGGRSGASAGCAPSDRRSHRDRSAADQRANDTRAPWSATSEPTPSPSPAGQPATA